jgi:hypothetical protein
MKSSAVRPIWCLRRLCARATLLCNEDPSDYHILDHRARGGGNCRHERNTSAVHPADAGQPSRTERIEGAGGNGEETGTAGEGCTPQSPPANRAHSRSPNKQFWPLPNQIAEPGRQLTPWKQKGVSDAPTPGHPSFRIEYQRAAAPFACTTAGTMPSCCIMPRASQLTRESRILPLAWRLMVIPSTDIFLFVGGMPLRSPL